MSSSSEEVPNSTCLNARKWACSVTAKEMIHFQTEELRIRYVIVANPGLIAIKDPDVKEPTQLRCLDCQSLFLPKWLVQSNDFALGPVLCIVIVAPT